MRVTKWLTSLLAWNNSAIDGNTSIQSANGLLIINRGGHVEIRGDIKSLKINGANFFPKGVNKRD